MQFALKSDVGNFRVFFFFTILTPCVQPHFDTVLLFNVKQIVQSICYKIARSAVLVENSIQEL